MMDDWTLRAVVSSQLNEAKKKSASKPVSRILFPGLAGVAIIPLAPALLPGSSDLPESCPSDGVGGAGTPPLLFGLAPCGVCPAPDITIGAVRSYLRVPKRPAPFHPYQSSLSPTRPRTAVCFLWHFPYRRRTVRFVDIPLRPSLLASTLPCGVRTFLSPVLAPVILFGPSRQ